ncbi:MAG: Flp family type IVb pilin [Alphaproteobacteria bacterium]|nr:Flp family type IVb pilin [Alphaproteobacteria bacterium]
MTSFSARWKRWSLRRFRANAQGTTAIEYALIASGVGMAIITTVFGLGSQLQTNWYAKIAAIFN